MSAQAVAQAYSATGAAWQRGPGRVYDRLAGVLVARSPVSLDGRRVLDLGAGTGAATRAIVAAGGSAIAVDVALGMLRASGPPRPPSALADARALPFGDRSLDGVVAAFSLNHVPDPEVALREAARVARPGSPLVASAYGSDDGHPVKQAVDAAAAELGWRPHPWMDELRATTMPLLATPGGARRAALDAGLHDVEIMTLAVAFPELDADALVAWRMGMAQLAPFIAELGVAQRDELRTRAVELLGDAPPLERRIVVIATVV